MDYRVMFVNDDDLPSGQDWVLAQDGERHTLFIKEGADLPSALEEAWFAFHNKLRAQARQPLPLRGLSPRRPGGLRVWTALASTVAVAAAVVAIGVPAAMSGFPAWSSAGAIADVIPLLFA